jgi:group II intron reverse transcriptase/maturase
MTDYFETKSQPITKVMVWQAYKKVRANKGGSGIDGMSWDYLDTYKKRELYKLWNRLTSGSYFPNPVRQVEIKKSDGGIRKLGIPTLLDRIAQEVVKQKLEPQVEPIFHNSSFGYRPNRSCYDAVAQSNRNAFNHDFAIDLDIKSFFDTIDHELLLKAVSHYCKERWILMYVSRWLKAGIVKQDWIELQTDLGTPQGGVISPLLANIYLHVVFDGWMEKNHPEKPFERYADDIVVHCKTEKQAQYMLYCIRKRMQACKLTLHETKTKIVNLRGSSERKYSKSYDFLGFKIRPNLVKMNGKGCLVPSVFVSTKSISAVLARFKKLNIHKRRTTIELLAKELSPMIRGIINYYHKFANGPMRYVWNQLNARLLKWVKWEKGLYKYTSIKWLKQKYKKQPRLFPHWELVHP